MSLKNTNPYILCKNSHMCCTACYKKILLILTLVVRGIVETIYMELNIKILKFLLNTPPSANPTTDVADPKLLYITL